MISSKQPVFLGEVYKFAPKPFHKSGFQPYKAREIPTHVTPVEKVKYPYVYMRFDHLKPFYVQHNRFEHPNLKNLEIHAVHKEKYDAEVEHLGIKDVMEKGTRPNEAKYEVGLEQTDGVKEFAIKNFQQEAGTENKLSRHRDEKDYENISALPFEERYKQFLANKKSDKILNQNHDDAIKATKSRTDISSDAKERIIGVFEKRKYNSNRKKTKVVPIATATPPAPPATPPAPPATAPASPATATASPATAPAPPANPHHTTATTTPAPPHPTTATSKSHKRQIRRMKKLSSYITPTNQNRNLFDQLGDTGSDDEISIDNVSLTLSNSASLDSLESFKNLLMNETDSKISESLRNKAISLGVIKSNSKIKNLNALKKTLAEIIKQHNK